MVSCKTSSIRKLSSDRNEQVRFYRWLNHCDVSLEALINASIKATLPFAKARHVLAIQDTTEINYQAHAERVKGLGTVGNGTDAGLFLHPLLIIDAQTSQGLGFGAIHTWNRTKKKAANYPSLPIEQKESYRWIETAEQGKRHLSEASCITFIGDRENDIYEFLDRIPDEKTHLLVRSRCDRCLVDGDLLWSRLKKQRVSKTYTLHLPRTPKRRARLATVELRYTSAFIKKPERCSDKQAAGEVKLSVVEVKEVGKAKEEAINWRLLTTHKVENIEDAEQIVDWYKQRWQIEQLFRTLKSRGIDIESSQLETETSLSKLVIVGLNAAMRIMQLVLAREGTTQHKTHLMFTEEEIECLHILQTKLEGRTQKQKNPYPPDNLAWASWIIGRLGGWKGYTKSEGPAGPIVMGEGLNKFYAIVEGYLLFKNTCTG